MCVCSHGHLENTATLSYMYVVMKQEDKHICVWTTNDISTDWLGGIYSIYYHSPICFFLI